jgi:beta-fructofuranosidase
MLLLPDAWTWDFWLADTGEQFHVFFLRASRALLDPDRRHRRAAVGHAVSTDLRSWTTLPDALVHADPPAFDDLATWTGSVLQAPDDGWRMFYTGLAHAERGEVQRIDSATSTDLISWHRPGLARPIEADPTWYEKRDPASGSHESWRDPWVFADPDPDVGGWHMLITARAAHGDPDDRGVVGHARSDDLEHWQVLPPLSSPGGGFSQLEVIQVENIDGRAVMIFSCLLPDLAAWRRTGLEPGGVWSVAADSLLGPFDLSLARPLTGPELYSGRIVQDRSGRWVLLAFRNQDERGDFVGGLSDPMAVEWITGQDGVAFLSIVRASTRLATE